MYRSEHSSLHCTAYTILLSLCFVLGINLFLSDCVAGSEVHQDVLGKDSSMFLTQSCHMGRQCSACCSFSHCSLGHLRVPKCTVCPWFSSTSTAYIASKSIKITKAYFHLDMFELIKLGEWSVKNWKLAVYWNNWWKSVQIMKLTIRLWQQSRHCHAFHHF